MYIYTYIYKRFYNCKKCIECLVTGRVCSPVYLSIFRLHTHTHTHTHIYIYIYIERERERVREREGSSKIGHYFSQTNRHTRTHARTH